jgi:hypothetical protein
MHLDNLLDSEPAFRSGEDALWLAVTIDAFLTLRDGGGYQEMARGWIEDLGNIFFEAVSDRLGYAPDGLRERIREAVKRSGEDRRASWQDRIRGKANRRAS